MRAQSEPVPHPTLRELCLEVGMFVGTRAHTVEHVTTKKLSRTPGSGRRGLGSYHRKAVYVLRTPSPPMEPRASCLCSALTRGLTNPLPLKGWETEA